MSFEFIKKFPNHIYVPKIVPLVYDDTLSYYEFLCKVLNKMNEAIESLNALGVRVDDLEAAVEQLQNIIDGMDDRLTTVENGLSTAQGDIRDLQTAVGNINGAINTINTTIEGLQRDTTNNTNAIVQINSAISDIRDTITDLDDIPDEIEALDARVTNLEAATFGDISVSPMPKNPACNMIARDTFVWEIVADATPDPTKEDQVCVPDSETAAFQGVPGFRFRGASSYNKTHLSLKNFVPFMEDTEAVTLMFRFNPAFSGLNYGQVITTTFGALKSGISCLYQGEDNVCIGGAKIEENDDVNYSYDLNLYVYNPASSDDYIENSYYSLNQISVIAASGLTSQGRIASEDVEPYFYNYQFTDTNSTEIDAIDTRLTAAEGDIDDLESAVGTFTQSDYDTTISGINNDISGLDTRLDTVEGAVSGEAVETWVTFSDVFENSVIPEGATIHHFRMDKKGRMITFELGMINLNDDSTFRYNSYNLGTIRSGLRAKLSPAMDMPVCFTGFLGGTDNNNPKGYLVSGSIPATTQNPPMPQVTGVAIASLYGAVGTNYYTSIETFGNLPPYSLIVKLEPWSVTSQAYRNSFIIRGTYLSE